MCNIEPKDFFYKFFEFNGAAQILFEYPQFMHVAGYCSFHGYENFIKGCLISHDLSFRKSHKIDKIQKPLFEKINFIPSEVDKCTIQNLINVYKSEFFRYPYPKDKKIELVLMSVPKKSINKKDKLIENDIGEVSDDFSDAVFNLVFNIYKKLNGNVQEVLKELFKKYVKI